MKWFTRRRLLWIALAAVVLSTGILWYQKTNHPDQPEITISRETTFITEPLTAEGLPDYQKALDERYRQGVTPENNAAIPFWQVFGPKSIPEPLREEFFKHLGIQPLPVEGEYFITEEQFRKSLLRGGIEFSEDELFDRFFEAHGPPWTTEQFPEVAKWLSANKKPLEKILEASRKPRFYSPILQADGGNETLSPLNLVLRDAFPVLAVRTMLHIGEGRTKSAQKDILTCRRLTRLTTRHVSSTARLVALAGDAIAFGCEKKLLNSGKLTARELLDYQAELRKLGPVPRVSDDVVLYDRFEILESVISLALQKKDDAEGIDVAGRLRSPPEELKEAWNKYRRKIRVELIDWNEVLRQVNVAFDDAVAVLQTKDFQARAERLEQMAAKHKRLLGDKENPFGFEELIQHAKGLWINQEDKKRATEWIVEIHAGNVVEYTKDRLNAEGRTRMYYELSLLALGICAYRADRGEYPESLDVLIPKYAAAIPEDWFSGQPVKYRRTAEGFVAYSVGENGEDNGGELGSLGDDLNVQLPLTKEF